MKRWTAFARMLTPAQCEAVVARAAARQLGTQRIEQIAPAQATEGWNLESRGYVPHAVLMRRHAVPSGQASLALWQDDAA
jgi:hypothetical protein